MKAVAWLGAAAAVLLLGACGSSRGPQDKSDWERQYEARLAPEEPEVLADSELPPYPRPANLIEFAVSAPGGFRFFIDRESLGVKDGVVRYTLVARSPSGVDTVNYEGLRCATSEHRIYAFGRPGGSWSMSTVPWREISPSNAQRWQFTLQKDFFCLHGKSIRSASEGIAALEKGGHPWVKSLDGSWNSGTR